MTDPLLTLLATIERLDREATPGPWTVLTDSDVTDPDYGHVIEWPTGIGAPSSKVIGYAEFGDNDDNDAELIAFSRNTLAPLASMLRVALDALTDIEDSQDEDARGFDQECARAALATIRRMAEEVSR